MGKKSKRPGTNPSSRTSAAVVQDDSVDVFRAALAACSLTRLRLVYEELGRDVGVTLDPEADRRAMEEEIVRTHGVTRLNSSYRRKFLRELKAVGGMRITCVPVKGKDRLKSFAYTTGFTGVGGKELLIHDEHRAGLNCHIFNVMFRAHQMGHPLRDGETIEMEGDNSGIIYKAVAPDAVEASLLKATKTLEATRLYGLSGYDVLCVYPFAERVKESKRAFRDLSKEEKLKLAKGSKVDGFTPITSGQVRMCAHCKITENRLGKNLMKCGVCKQSFYCSKSCQKSDYKLHKAYCARSKEDKLRDYVDFVDTEDQDTLIEMVGRGVGDLLKGVDSSLQKD